MLVGGLNGGLEHPKARCFNLNSIDILSQIILCMCVGDYTMCHWMIHSILGLYPLYNNSTQFLVTKKCVKCTLGPKSLPDKNFPPEDDFGVYVRLK